MDNTYIKPRPIHPKSVSNEEKKAFEKSRTDSDTLLNCGYKILTGDESSHILGWNVQKGWHLKGILPAAPMVLSRDRFYSIVF